MPGTRLSITLCLCSLAASGGAAEFEIPLASADVEYMLPAPDGEYAVGVRGFSWIDASRLETASPGASGHREVTVQIWYPAEPNSDATRALYFPELDQMLAAADELPEDEARYVRLHAVLGGKATNSVPGSALAESADPWPIILFSPGGNVSRHAQTALAERLASNGFVFVSMSHPYSTIDVAPATGFSMSIDWGLEQDDPVAARAADDRLADLLAGDARFVLQQLRTLNGSDESFKGVLDFQRVGIAGHSRGGTTVGRACAGIREITACAVLDNIGPDREQQTGVNQSLLALRAPWDEQRVADLHAYLERSGGDVYDIEIAGSNHFSCTDLPLFIEDVRADGLEPLAGIDTCADVLAGFFGYHLWEWDPLGRYDMYNVPNIEIVFTQSRIKVDSARPDQ